MKKLLAIFLLAAGCTPDVKDLHYFQDSRTGVCFLAGTVNSTYNYKVSGPVPCEKVPAALLEIIR